MKRGFDARQTDLRVWTPDVFGSICFLVSSAWPTSWSGGRQPAWRIAALNLLGSVFFGVSAVAALVEPSTSEPVSAAIAERRHDGRRAVLLRRRTDVDPEGPGGASQGGRP